MPTDSLLIAFPFLNERFTDFADWAGSSNANAPLVTSLGIATVGAMSLYWAWSRSSNDKIVPLVNPKKQTRILEDGSRISSYTKNNELRMFQFPDAKTLFEVIRRGKRISNNGPMLGYRNVETNGSEPYMWMRYSEIIDRSINVARGIRYLGLPIGQETFIGVYSQNRPEWIIIEQATYAFNNVLVPLYDTLGTDASSYIINQANIQIVFCDTIDKVEGLLKKKSQCECLKYIVLISDEQNITDLQKRANDAGVQIHTFAKIEYFGKENNVITMVLNPPTPDDLSTICYTSGTTGDPKGVMLTHGNIIADSTVAEYFKHAELNENDVMLSFLPLAHMFERIMHTAIYSAGGSVGFFRGDIKKLADDIKSLRPTVLPVVPRVLNRLYDKVLSEINKSVLKRFIFNTAIAIKSRELRNWVVRNDSILDNLVFKKVREGLGGRVKLLVTGSAPISESVLTFIRCAMGCIVIEGYGQTECVAASTVTIEGEFVAGHVGIPAPCNIIKLIEAPELGYHLKDQAGEVCIKGTNVFKGYYKMPELTQETIIDGWLHTGDIGKWTDCGTLKIIDRKKHIFKLAQGEYVAPEKIENIYSRSKYVAQCFVHGESLKTCLIAIVVPDPDVLLPFAKSTLNIDGSIDELCKHQKVKELILSDMINIGKEAGLFSFEQVKDIFLCPEMFGVDNNLLTPTLKSKRPLLKMHFQQQIDELYKNFD